MPGYSDTRDPRSTTRYRKARQIYIAAHDGIHPCCLCGQMIDTSLPGSSMLGPTIEHRIPVRTLRLIASTWEELVDLTCDTSSWGLAHHRCQKRQGGTVSARAINAKANTSRW